MAAAVTATPETLEIPLFPLGTVLFPGGILPLQIFETRYLDLVRRCLRDDRPFGVVLILDGNEARRRLDEAAPRIAAIGTLARIVDFTERPNRMLGITVRGEGRFRVLATAEQPDHLLTGQVEVLPDAESAPVPPASDTLVGILRQLLEHPAVNRLGVEADLDDARSVTGRLAELLPLDPGFKQDLLEEEDPLVGLAELERLVHGLQQQAE